VKTLGNVLAASGADYYDRIGTDPCYEAVKSPATSPGCCHDCFTHYDVVNLFVEGRISADEMQRLPFFSVPGVLQELLRLRERFEATQHSGLRGPLLANPSTQFITGS
jgi:hypothetical protein